MSSCFLLTSHELNDSYFWGPRDWAGMFAANKLMTFPYIGMTGTPTTDQDVGLEDYHDRTYMLDCVIGCILKVSN